MGFTVKKGSKKGSQKWFLEGGFQKLPGTPLGEYDALGVRPIYKSRHFQVMVCGVTFCPFSRHEGDPKGSKRCFPNGVFQIPLLDLQQR